MSQKPPSKKTIGQVGFESWNQRCIPGLNVAWENIPPDAQEGWERIAEDIVDAHNATKESPQS